MIATIIKRMINDVNTHTELAWKARALGVTVEEFNAGSEAALQLVVCGCSTEDIENIARAYARGQLLEWPWPAQVAMKVANSPTIVSRVAKALWEHDEAYPGARHQQLPWAKIVELRKANPGTKVSFVHDLYMARARAVITALTEEA